MQTPLQPLQAKPHYSILDGLRGVAALVVVAFHLCEAHATSRFDQLINHGYLAVDFFFLLSGFVVGYAYDDRWDKITPMQFFKRRLIRLQPMVILGMLIGALCFYFQDSVLWPDISDVVLWKVVLIMLIGFLMIPVPPSLDIRGWIEMYPLNGPAWSLFFEYLANILYGAGVRKFPNVALAALVAISGAGLVYLTVAGTNGDVIGGWSLEPSQFYIGVVRVMFPFFAGLLLCRVAKLSRVRNAFFWTSLLVVLFLAMPRIGGSANIWLNGLYESLVIIIIFPFIIYLGASGDVKGKFAGGVCRFLGDISYPIYITHYPIIYIYTGWVHDNKLQISHALPIACLAFAVCVALAWFSFKLYDLPARKWLTSKLMK